MAMTSKTSETPQASTEVEAKARRRSFTTAYKLDVLRRADGCRRPGEVAALLRREGLYSSHLCVWRKARASGEMNPTAPKKRGPVPTVPDARDRTIAEQERTIAKLVARAERAEQLIELQKKVAELFGETLPDTNGAKR
jgi:transposase